MCQSSPEYTVKTILNSCEYNKQGFNSAAAMGKPLQAIEYKVDMADALFICPETVNLQHLKSFFTY